MLKRTRTDRPTAFGWLLECDSVLPSHVTKKWKRRKITNRKCIPARSHQSLPQLFINYSAVETNDAKFLFCASPKLVNGSIADNGIRKKPQLRAREQKFPTCAKNRP